MSVRVYHYQQILFISIAIIISDKPITQMDFNNENISIFACQFEAFVEKAKVQIKFPCNYFLQWKANNGKVIVSSQNKHQASKSQIHFNQTLSINVNILYDKVNKKYLKKESLLMINLISKSRPDQIKLVGRVAIDLADVLNLNSFDQLTTTQLQYCSVEAFMNFCVKSVSIQESAMHVSELDRSSFNEYMAFQSNLKPYSGFMTRNEGSSTQRDFDDNRSAKGSQKGEIRSLGRDKNKMSSPSLTKQPYTPMSRTVIRTQTTTLHQQNKVNRSNSIPKKTQSKQPQNSTDNFFSPKSNDPQQQAQNESNFSFHKTTEEQNIKSKTSTSQFFDNDSRPSINSSKAVGNIEFVLPKQPASTKWRDLTINTQNLKSPPLTIRKPDPLPPSVTSPKHSQQQQLLKRLKGQHATMSQRQSIIKRLETQVQSKKATFPSTTLPPTSSIKQLHTTTHLSLQLSKTNSQSKRIIGLTEALNELETKYTKLTLETEEMRSGWRKEKEELLSLVSINEAALGFKDRELREKSKVVQLLQHNLGEIEKGANQRLAEVICLRSQLAEAEKQCKRVNEQKAKVELTLKQFQEQVKLLTDQSSQSQDNLNKTFADRLSLYQQKATDAQQRLLASQKQRQSLSTTLQHLQSRESELCSKISAFQQQKKSFQSQILQSQKDLFSMKHETQHLRKQITRKQQQSREQKEKLWSSKDEQVSYQLRAKDEEIDRVRKEAQARILKVQQQSARQVERLKGSEEQLRAKVDQLENTIFSLSDQIASYEGRIQELSGCLEKKESEFRQVSLQHSSVSEEQKLKQGEHEELMLALNGQIEGQQGRITQLEGQVEAVAQSLKQKQLQFLQSTQQSQSYRSQLQLIRAQTTILQQKMIEQHQHYQKQAESMKMSCSQQIYELQILLQQQVQKYQELQHLKNILKDSLDEWQNKCTEDKIASSRAVSRLNDIIKEKEETMYEMENIMRALEKEKMLMQAKVRQEEQEFGQVVQNYRLRQGQYKQAVEEQQVQFVRLYEAVKVERQKLKEDIAQRDQIIGELQHKLQQHITQVASLNTHIHSLQQTLQTTQQTLLSLQTTSQSTLTTLKLQHNQQLDEYEQRIRQLQTIINQKDNEILDREMIVIDLEKEKEELGRLIEGKIVQIGWEVERQRELKEGLDRAERERGEMERQVEEWKAKVQEEKGRVEEWKEKVEQEKRRYTQLENTLIQCEETLGARIALLEGENKQLHKQLESKIALLEQASLDHQQNLQNLQSAHNLKLQQQSDQHLKSIEQLKESQKAAQQQLLIKLQSLQQQITFKEQLLVQQATLATSLTQEKNQLSNELTSLKSQRQTLLMLNFKQQTQKLKQQVKSLTQQNLQMRSQLKQIPSLQRTIKIKTIELNSLKYKSSLTSTSSSHSIDPDQVSHVEQIIKLKNEEIDLLKKESERMKEIELQLYQVQALNEELYQNIEQYEEEKFHLCSGVNQRDIRLAEIQEEVRALAGGKAELKERNAELMEKIKYYENLILDFKGHEMSSTKSQSEKMNNSHSRTSSNKIIPEPNESQVAQKFQVETFVKKIRLLEMDLQKMKIKDEENLVKNQELVARIQELEGAIKQLEGEIAVKNVELSKKVANSTKPVVQPSKPQIQYRNPQQVAQTFKQLQGLLKKRSQFHDLQLTLIKIHESNRESSTKQKILDQEAKEKLANTNEHVMLLSKEFQNLKARIMKLEGKNYQEKAKIISLLRPCEESLKEITKLYDVNNQASRQSSMKSLHN